MELKLSHRLGIRIPTWSSLPQSIGGNQQKLSLAKWLAADVDILIVDEPTVGININAKASIHELINGLVDTDIAILLISSVILRLPLR